MVILCDICSPQDSAKQQLFDQETRFHQRSPSREMWQKPCEYLPRWWLNRWTNPSEKYSSKWVHLPQSSGWKLKMFPIGSMYGISTCICHKNQPNVSKYTIHGSYGFETTTQLRVSLASSFCHPRLVRRRAPAVMWIDFRKTDLPGPMCRNTVDGSEIRPTSWYGKYPMICQGFIYARWLISRISEASTVRP